MICCRYFYVQPTEKINFQKQYYYDLWKICTKTYVGICLIIQKQNNFKKSLDNQQKIWYTISTVNQIKRYKVGGDYYETLCQENSFTKHTITFKNIMKVR